MPVAGLRGTGDWGPAERPKNFREMIQWMRPNGDTPLIALTSRVGKRSVDDPEFNWWAEPMDLVRLQVNKAGNIAAGETLIVVDSGDPTASVIKSNYGKATHLVPGDVLMVEPAVDSATDNYERVVVTQVHNDTSFSVTRGAYGTTPATIANNAYLLKIGTIYEEGSAGPQSSSRNPLKYSNYCQIFKTGYEVTATAMKTRARTGDVLSNDKKRKSFDHARDIEMALLWGRKSETTGPDGKPMRSMAGLRSFIPTANTHILGPSWGLAKSAAAGNNLMDMISPVFDYVSDGGDTRIAFCGNGCLNALNKAIISSSGAAGVSMDWGMDKAYWGMNFRELRLPQGKLMLKTHPMLSRHSLYTHSMWILDFSAIKYVYLNGRDTKGKDNIQADDEDLQRGMWLSEISLEVTYGGQTMGYIGGFNNAPA